MRAGKLGDSPEVGAVGRCRVGGLTTAHQAPLRDSAEAARSGVGLGTQRLHSGAGDGRGGAGAVGKGRSPHQITGQSLLFKSHCDLNAPFTKPEFSS